VRFSQLGSRMTQPTYILIFHLELLFIWFPYRPVCLARHYLGFLNPIFTEWLLACQGELWQRQPHWRNGFSLAGYASSSPCGYYLRTPAFFVLFPIHGQAFDKRTHLLPSLIKVTVYIKGSVKHTQNVYVSIRLDEICNPVMSI